MTIYLGNVHQQSVYLHPGTQSSNFIDWLCIYRSLLWTAEQRTLGGSRLIRIHTEQTLKIVDTADGDESKIQKELTPGVPGHCFWFMALWLPLSEPSPCH